MNKDKKAFIIGAIWGAFAPFLGTTIGIKVSAMLGSIFLFPFIMMKNILGVNSLESISESTLAIVWMISIISWGIVFVCSRLLIEYIKEKRAV